MRLDAHWYTGDALTVMRTLPDASVDLVLTSPPFLALRSYLPADHPDKASELGSESGPGLFVDALVEIVEECRRVLTSHGSLVVELGDTYSGSGGGGGDYLPGGLRDGQAQFAGSSAAARESNAAHWRQKNQARDAWPLAKSLTMIPELVRVTLAYGQNPLTGRVTERWRIRNVIRWVRPNPPVGALGDKFRPGTSDMLVACVAKDRYFDLDAVRQRNDRTDEQPYVTDRHEASSEVMTKAFSDKASGERMVQNPGGSPPLDWWPIPTQGFKGSHYATWPKNLLTKPILSMCPAFVCTECGTALGLFHDETMRGMQQPDRAGMDQAPIRVEESAVLFKSMLQSEHGPESGIDKGMGKNDQRLHNRLQAGPSDGTQDGIRSTASQSNGGIRWTRSRIVGSRASQERDQGRQPDRESDTDDENGTRQVTEATPESSSMSSLWRVDPNATECPACGGVLRRGRVLDPFAGSGTTLEVATGLGRSCIGIDLDERNVRLAERRVGMFLTVV